MKRKEVLNLEGQVSKITENLFFIETEVACFVWLKSENTLKDTPLDYAEVCEENKVDFPTDEGYFRISDLTGEAVTFESEEK